MFLLFFLGILLALCVTRRLISQKKFEIVLYASVSILLLLAILPRQIFGKWNSISNLNKRHVKEVLLIPSNPESNLDLIKKVEIISSRNEIDSIISLLRRTEVYYLNRYPMVWKTKMIIVTAENDSLELEILKKENDETVVNSNNEKSRKDELGEYLEKILKVKERLGHEKSHAMVRGSRTMASAQLVY
jgi:hypothetical protein